MERKLLAIAAFATVAMLSGYAIGQVPAGVDPACMIKNADGSDAIDTTKCPDGKTVAANQSNTGQADTTASTSSIDGTLIVPAQSLAGAKIMSANDFIGKRVYSRTGDDIGEVNDLILTDKGDVQAVILGVGGFLGVGEKNVAVTMASIEMAQNGNTTRLVVNGTKDQFNAAPAYDKSTRTYK